MKVSGLALGFLKDYLISLPDVLFFIRFTRLSNIMEIILNFNGLLAENKLKFEIEITDSFALDPNPFLFIC